MNTIYNTYPKYGICSILVDNQHNEMIYLYIYENDIPIPHFHVLHDQTQQDVSICLFEAKYLQHHKDVEILDSYDLQILNNILHSQYNSSLTDWERLVELWNILSYNKSHYKYNRGKNLIQPDYSSMTKKDIKRRSIWQTIVSKWKA